MKVTCGTPVIKWPVVTGSDTLRVTTGLFLRHPIKTLQHIREYRPYYTMLCLTCVFDFFRVFTCVFDTNMFVSKAQVKMQEKHKKMQEKFSILHYAFGKNESPSHFSHVIARVSVNKPYQNATPTHSEIWAYWWKLVCDVTLQCIVGYPEPSNV